jgi:predicted CoA-binding protein
MRLSSPHVAELKHHRYCVPSPRLRTSEPADTKFFETLAQCDSNVPVVLIFTRKDELEGLIKNRVEKEYMDKHGFKSRRGLHNEDWDNIDIVSEENIDLRKQELTDGFAGHEFLGPLFISHGKIALRFATEGLLLTHYRRRRLHRKTS